MCKVSDTADLFDDNYGKAVGCRTDKDGLINGISTLYIYFLLYIFIANCVCRR